MSVCLIYNPTAGSAETVRDSLEQSCHEGGCQIVATREGGDAERAARRAVENGVGRLIAAGGDGTINEVLNGIAPDFAATELAIVPLGTGNDFARSLGLNLLDPLQALEQALGNQSEPVDVGLVKDDTGERYFLNACSSGFGSLVTSRIEDDRKEFWGRVSYWMEALAAAGEAPIYDAQISTDDRSFHATIHGFMVANGRYVAGGLPIAPHALLNDGLLDLVMFTETDFLSGLGMGIELLLGAHEQNDGVISLQAKEILVEATPRIPLNVDGEHFGDTSPQFTLSRTKLRIVPGDPLERSDGTRNSPHALG